MDQETPDERARTGPVDPLIGRTVGGRFTITSFVGEGWSTRTYLAEQRIGARARQVAVKVLNGPHAADPGVVERFRREVGVVTGLTAPGAVKIFDFGLTDDGACFVVLEPMREPLLLAVLDVLASE